MVDFKWNGQFPKKKNWALENIPWKHEWILILDADERIMPELAEAAVVRATAMGMRPNGVVGPTLPARAVAAAWAVALWCLLGALLVMALSDSTFTYMSDVASYSSASAHLVDTGWLAAYLGIALAAFSSRSDGAVPANAEHARPSLASLVAPLLPVLIALTVAAVEIKLGHHLDRAAWLMACGLIALVLARQGLAILELLAPSRDPRADPMQQRATRAALGDAQAEQPPHSGYWGSGYEPL